jgi:N utilization substance protein B
MYELNHMIEKYARGWRLERISRVAAAIMRCAMCEILYMDDVPNAAAINEAVELAKGYEEPETVAFINGVLGSFVRGEVEPEAEEEQATSEEPAAEPEQVPENGAEG